jgi:hypothetical protein
LDGSSDVVMVGKMKHLYSGAESRVCAQNHEGPHSERPKNGFVTGRENP